MSFSSTIIPNLSNGRLSEDEVNRRLDICENPEIVDELYDFGRDLVKENADRVKAIESKATSFAAYGTALVTLLVSSSASWSKLGNAWSLWIALCAGICGLMCACFSIRALTLRKLEVVSENEWLKAECLYESVAFLKKYRILTLWGAVDSYIETQGLKAKELRRGQEWLTASVGYLVLLLFQLTFFGTCNNSHWAAGWPFLAGHTATLGSLCHWSGGLGLCLTMVLITRHIWTD